MYSHERDDAAAQGGKALWDSNREPESLGALYKRLCNELECKPNSSLFGQLSEYTSPASLTELRLANNYVGPKGLQPLMRLIHICQGLELVDLRGNGMDNESAVSLCDALWNHCKISHLLIGSNPISLEAGKRILALVEHNNRIVNVELRDTNIFDSLVSRIEQAAAVNRNWDGASDQPQLLQSKLSGLRLLPAITQPRGSVTLSGSSRKRRGKGLHEKEAVLVPIHLPAKASGRAGSWGERTSGERSGDAGPAPEADGGQSDEAVYSSGLWRHATSRDRRVTDKEAAANGNVGADGQPHSVVHGGPPRRRPPPPAIASDRHSRLTEAHRNALRRKFAERSQLFRQGGLSEASKVADRARAELWLLERGVGQTGGPHGVFEATLKSTSVPSGAPADPPIEVSALARLSGDEKRAIDSEDDRAGGRATAADGNRSCTASPLNPDDSSPDGSRMGASPGRILSAKHSVALLRGLGSSDGMNSDANPQVQPQQTQEGSQPAAYATATVDRSALIRTMLEDGKSPMDVQVSELGVSPQTSSLTSSEEFKRLFDIGCREYALKNADAAYMAWNDAMEIAVMKKNREWIAILTNNLQRLSYELLVSEGTTQLEHHHLEQADQAFRLAHALAKKAKNAAWEAEMSRARKAVLRLVFQQRHEAALTLFERARTVPNESITDNDLFVVPGTDRLTPHTQTFVEEWTRMLLIKEAVDAWVDAASITVRIGSQFGVPLKEVVKGAVDDVTCYLVERLLQPESVDHVLSLQKTSSYTYEECVALAELWENLYACSKSQIAHPHFDALGCLQLGNLYLATNQLSIAQTYFERAAECEVKLFSLYAAMCMGILHWQRAGYALAERHFLHVLDMLVDIEAEQLVIVSNAAATAATADPTDTPTSSKIGELSESTGSSRSPRHAQGTLTLRGGNATTPTIDALLMHKKLLTAVPKGLFANMRARCFKFLVSTFTSSYRYRESLEVLERGLMEQYRDTLAEKMALNFTMQPTLDHIIAIAEMDQTPLVYYETCYQFRWNSVEKRYAVDEYLLSWVVPPRTEMRFAQVNLTQDFKIASLSDTVSEVRRGLHVEPLASEGVSGSIITELHSTTWMAPLKQLYAVLLQPVMDFIKTLDVSFLSNSGLLTVVPTACLWRVPFHALILPNGKYLVEEVAVQFAFCATQTAFNRVCALRAAERRLHRTTIVVQAEAEVDLGDPYGPPFPVDAFRSMAEGECLVRQAMERKQKRAQLELRLRERSALLDPQEHFKVSSNSRTSATDVRLSDGTEPTREVHGDEGVEAGAEKSRSQPDGPSADASLTAATACPPQMPSAGVGSGDVADIPTVVDDIEDVRDLLQTSLILHFATASNSHVVNSDGTCGALYVANASKRLELLRASEIAHTDMFAELVVMSNTNFTPSRAIDAQDGLLCLMRSFFAAGAVSLVFGQWCTPDMIPAEFFTRFYDCIERNLRQQYSHRMMTAPAALGDGESVIAKARAATATAAAMNRNDFGVRARPAPLVPNLVAATSTDKDSSKSYIGVAATVSLARAIAYTVRAMLQDGMNRHAPHRWAGYYVVGALPSPPTSGSSGLT